MPTPTWRWARLLERSGLSSRDRGLVTDLVYGTTRMRRACDWLVERFLTREPDPQVRAALRIGAYQLVFADVPPHAAVSATVGAAGRAGRRVRERGAPAGGRCRPAGSRRVAERRRAAELPRLDRRLGRHRARAPRTAWPRWRT